MNANDNSKYAQPFLDGYESSLQLPDSLSKDYLLADSSALKFLDSAKSTPNDSQEIQQLGASLSKENRQLAQQGLNINTFIQEYPLNSEAGKLLLGLAEALLRIPDHDTAIMLLKDKLPAVDWQAHKGKDRSLPINISAWGLGLAKRILTLGKVPQPQQLQTAKGSISEVLMLKTISYSVQVLGKQFIIGNSIEQALKQASKSPQQLSYSFDMLGESAVCDADAQAYYQSYLHAIETLGTQQLTPPAANTISIKLSALEARLEPGRQADIMQNFLPRMLNLIKVARQVGVYITIDAEESWRMGISLQIFKRLLAAKETTGWSGLGMVVQAYQKRAPACIDFLIEQAQMHKIKIPVRLVKGAYWDNEIKRTQQLGLENYPVYRIKAATDLSFQMCATKILASPVLYGQFASHNPYSLAYVLQNAKASGNSNFELQSLYGMGKEISTILRRRYPEIRHRIYAPVGKTRELLPYLMRRLLENGANSSFINHILDNSIDINTLSSNPYELLLEKSKNIEQKLPLPSNIFAPARQNSKSINLDDDLVRNKLLATVAAYQQQQWQGWPQTSVVLDDSATMQAKLQATKVFSPAAIEQCIGTVHFAHADLLNKAMDQAVQAQSNWQQQGVKHRAKHLLKLSELLEENFPELIALCVFEAGKTVPCALAEIREAVDFCRYYAQQALTLMPERKLPGVTGEDNYIFLEGKGVFLCISPWNFPVAIFIGQIVAALVTGNTVVAKPSEYSSLTAIFTIQLAYQAGIPATVLHCLPSPGPVLEESILRHPHLSGVLFTGSTATAKRINNCLAKRDGPIVSLVAETGGLNCMIVDNSALLEQAVADIMVSAFDSAGQRCSALRMLYVQTEIAPELIRMLTGAIKRLKTGHPLYPDTDSGPLINNAALTNAEAYISELKQDCKLLAEAPIPATLDGFYIAPALYQKSSLQLPAREVFAPILCLATWKHAEFNTVIEQIHNSNYALTLGLHTRIESRIEHVKTHLPIGNMYINRNMTGAVVESQPFGGSQLSGTGPKAGGPAYLSALCRERTVSINSTAMGGDIELLSQDL